MPELPDMWWPHSEHTLWCQPDNAAAIIAAVCTTNTIHTVLIDGRSGSGKTTLARQLSALTKWPVVHMDDLYPGWSGLDEGSTIVARDVLSPRRAGYYAWDWDTNTRGAFITVDSRQSLIVEGCGALTCATRAAAAARGDVTGVICHLDSDTRRQRALARDPFFHEFWDMWAEQENQRRTIGTPDIVVVPAKTAP